MRIKTLNAELMAHLNARLILEKASVCLRTAKNQCQAKGALCDNNATSPSSL